ncbi:MAG: PAS domain S-box protein, partial [Candidatus Thiodiazotropha sp. 6PLUC4]
GVIQEVNDKLLELVDFEQSELINNNISMLMPDKDASQHDHHISRYLKEGTSKVIGTSREVQVKKKDGKTIPCILTLSEVTIDNRHWFVGLLKSLN